jgi:hypothetical protein
MSFLHASVPDTTNPSPNVASATDDKSFISESFEDEIFNEEHKLFQIFLVRYKFTRIRTQIQWENPSIVEF